MSYTFPPRVLCPADPALLEVYRAELAESCRESSRQGLEGLTGSSLLASLMDLSRSEHACVGVAVDDDRRLAGFGLAVEAVWLWAPRVAWLAALHTQDGQPPTVAENIITALEAWAVARGHRRMISLVRHDGPVADGWRVAAFLVERDLTVRAPSAMIYARDVTEDRR